MREVAESAGSRQARCSIPSRNAPKQSPARGASDSFSARELVEFCAARFNPGEVLQGQFLGFEATLHHLNRTGDSFIRFGDGEFIVLHGGGIYYQPADPRLTAALWKIIRSYRRGCGYLLGLPFGYLTRSNAEIRANDRGRGQPGHSNIFYLMKDSFRRHFPRDMPYGSTATFRANAERAREIGDALWSQAEVLFLVTSSPENAALLQPIYPRQEIRIVPVPPENAFAEFEEILRVCLEESRRSSSSHCFVVAAGPAAKALVYELAAAGCRAYDVGHLFSSLRRLSST